MGRPARSVAQSTNHLRAHRPNADVSNRRSRTGFTFDNLDHAAIAHDNPIDHLAVRDAKGLRPGGFGVLTVRASVDELVYNQKQNEVIFIKYLS
jgi:hypothetical protein